MNQPALMPRPHLQGPLKEAFQAFWTVYPPRKPNPRAVAEAIFGKLVREGFEPAALRRAAEAFAVECAERKVDLTFVPLAATWLRQRRFEDYLQEPVAEPAAPAIAQPEGEWWEAMRGHVSASDFRAWIAPLVLISHDHGQQALIKAPSPFHRDHVRREFSGALRRALGVGRVDVLTEAEIEL